jgi:predicted nucleic acid-binding protein
MTPARQTRGCVLDASVVAAAFFREEFERACRSLLASGRTFHAPDLIYVEVANVIWKRERRGEIDRHEAEGMLSDILSLPVLVTPSLALVEVALELAMSTRQTAYDCLYVALAIRSNEVLFTADRRLANALADTPIAKHVTWIGEGV